MTDPILLDLIASIQSAFAADPLTAAIHAIIGVTLLTAFVVVGTSR